MKKESGAKPSRFTGLIARLVVAWAWIRPSRAASERRRVTSSSEPGNLPVFSTGASLFILIGLSLAFVVWGLFVFSTVGVKWPPPWNFGQIDDVPASSSYSSQVGRSFGAEPKRFATGPPEPQHVMGRPGTSAPGTEGK